MDRTNRQRLNEAFLRWHREKHPTLPERARPAKYDRTDNNANGLTKCILDWLKWHNCQAERVNTMGKAVVRKNRFEVGIYGTKEVTVVDWIPTTGRKGSADIHATIPIELNGKRLGLSVKIEIKYGKDRQSQHQKEYQTEIIDAGGHYYIVRTFDDFLAVWDRLCEEFCIFAE